MLSRLGVLFMRLLAPMPLGVVRGLGTLLGWFLYFVVPGRRRVVRVNLELCFPGWTEQKRRELVPRVFVAFAQAWLDRSWLWHGDPEAIRRRVRLTGAVQELEGMQPTVVFWPHFVGMDAGWSAITMQTQRPFMTIYTNQANAVVDAWILRGRQRFGNVRLFGRTDGVKPVVAALRQGVPLCLLPDMNFGPEESIFVPFFGVPAATVPSLSRFARLGRAKVVPLLTRITPSGYDVEVLPAWDDVPSDDLVADTALQNERLARYIETMPEQYYWVHKRFKTRPEGQPPVY